MKIKIILAGIFLVAAIAVRAATTNDLATVLRNGLFEEQVNHNLDAAIATYQSLVTQFDKDRQLAATAAFRLGECYRTLGKTNEAAVQYQRVIREFPDQTTLATLSRQNLAGLGQSATPSAVSNSAQQEQKRLLEDEIKLAEQQWDAIKKQIEAGQAPPADSLMKQREILVLRQRLAALGNTEIKSGSDEEDQEIRRIQAMIQNSPDLINAASGGDYSSTPLIRAARADQLQVARFLLEHGADVNRSANDSTPLFAAAFTGHKKMVELLLDNGADVNATVSGGRTALLVAVIQGFQAVVEVLLARNADPKLATSDKMTALHTAAERSSKKIVELLLARGAEVNAKGRDDKTPLHLAANRPDIISLLLASKVDVNARDKSASTPLHYASGTQAIKLLLANGADVNARNSSGETPLGRSYRSLESVNALLDAGADPNLVATSGEREGWGPLHYAAENGNAAIAEALLKHGAKSGALTGFRMPSGRYNGSSPLILAINNQRSDTVKVLLNTKADPNLPNADGQKPLQLAIDLRNIEMMEALLRAGADVNAPTKDGVTPLQMAIFTESKTLVETVLAYHPDVNAIGVGNETALGLTRGNPQRVEIAALLRARGALDKVPRFDRIQISRPSANFLTTAFWKGTNDWNRFTLMELIAAYYGFVSTATTNARAFTYFDPVSLTSSNALMFPAWERIRILRPSSSGAAPTEISVDLNGIFKSGDCSQDVPLAWGDVIEIPESDHPIGLKWQGFGSDQRGMLQDCLKRELQLTVKNQTTNLVLTPKAMSGESITYGSYGRIIWYAPSFTLLPVLNNSGMLRISSDLAHIKVTRRDPPTGKKREWILDCSNPQSSPDLWLRDGDVIDVPEK